MLVCCGLCIALLLGLCLTETQCQGSHSMYEDKSIYVAAMKKAETIVQSAHPASWNSMNEEASEKAVDVGVEPPGENEPLREVEGHHKAQDEPDSRPDTRPAADLLSTPRGGGAKTIQRSATEPVVAVAGKGRRRKPLQKRRDRPGQRVARDTHRIQIRKPEQLQRDLAAELVVPKVNELQEIHPPHARRDRTPEAVVREVKGRYERELQRDVRRDRSGETVARQVEGAGRSCSRSPAGPGERGLGGAETRPCSGRRTSTSRR